MEKNNIVLVGFPGTGKTTISKLLVEHFTDGWKIIDTDQQIEEKSGKTIPQIFAEQGEAYFRRLESDVLADIMLGNKQVISTGGGAVLQERNRQQMLANGFVVALTATKETIIERVRQDGHRPLLEGDIEQKVDRLLHERKHAYDFADIKLDTTGLTAEEVMQQLVLRWRKRAIENE